MALIALGNIAVLGAFAGYAGGGGLANATYSNFVRDKGWGMGCRSARSPVLSAAKHLALVTSARSFRSRRRIWRGGADWWRYILTDQVFIWGPGCVMGMALPALLSLRIRVTLDVGWTKPRLGTVAYHRRWHSPRAAICRRRCQGVVDRHSTGRHARDASQPDVDRRRVQPSLRQTSSGRAAAQVRENLSGNQVRRIYYSILSMYVCGRLFVRTFSIPMARRS